MKNFLSLLAVGLVLSAVAHADTRLRIMAANLSTGKDQSYDPGEGARIFQGLQPDVVLIQEFNYKKNLSEAQSDPDLRRNLRRQNRDEFVASTFKTKSKTNPETKFTQCSEEEDSDQIPNGIISRFPIKECFEWKDTSYAPNPSNRDFAVARIDIPGDIDLWAISVHLYNKKASGRALQARALVNLIKEKIPTSDYLVLGGDLNAKVRSEEVITILSEVVSEEKAPTRVDGNSNTNMNGKYAYDWVLGNSLLREKMIPVLFHPDEKSPNVRGIEYQAFQAGLVFNSDEFTALPWIAPVLKSDSVADGMQHFAVVKDFLIDSQ